jgi:hypothetical protein
MDIYVFGAIGITAGVLTGSLARGTPWRRAALYAACTVIAFVVLEWAIQQGFVASQDVAVLLVASLASIVLYEVIQRRRPSRQTP